MQLLHKINLFTFLLRSAYGPFHEIHVSVKLWVIIIMNHNDRVSKCPDSLQMSFDDSPRTSEGPHITVLGTLA
jgi:hypothetical protein